MAGRQSNPMRWLRFAGNDRAWNVTLLKAFTINPQSAFRIHNLLYRFVTST
jgi:hypothetical protein